MVNVRFPYIVAVVFALAIECNGQDVPAHQNDSSSVPGGKYSDYVVADIYQHYEGDSLKFGQVFGVTSGWYVAKTRFVLEWQRPLISFVKIKSREDKDRLASTALAMSFAMAIPAWTMALAGCSEEKINEAVKYVFFPWGPHIGYRPSRLITIYAGMIPDFLLFTEKDDGLFLQWRIGVRIDVKAAFVLSAGYAKTRFKGFESADRQFPGGIFVGLSYSRPDGSFEYNQPDK